MNTLKLQNTTQASNIGSLLRNQNGEQILGRLENVIEDISRVSGLDISDKGLIKDHPNITLWIKDHRGQKYFLKIGTDDFLASEVFWYRTAKEHGINVPQVLASSLSEEQVRFIIMEFAEGRDLEDIAEADTRERAAFLAGMELRKLHAIETGGFGSMGLDGVWSDDLWTTTLKKFMGIESKLTEGVAEVFSKEEVDHIAKIIFSEDAIKLSSGRLLHCDVQPENILYLGAEDRVVLIDPRRLISGDPMFDLARSRVPWPRMEAFYDKVSEGYQSSGSLEKEEEHRLNVYYLVCLFYATASAYRQRTVYSDQYKEFKRLLVNAAL
jgi:fructosamine-3-kinase